MRWFGAIRSAVDDRLERYFAQQRERAAALSAGGEPLTDAVADLTLRGGKRLRPALLCAAFRATSGDAPATLPAAVIDVCASLELLQTFLLIHDDWMDQDERRRGGPTVHAAMRRRHGDKHLGDSLAILAGNLASAYAWQLVTHADTPPETGQRLLRVFFEMHQEVVHGQQLDLLAAEDVSLMQQLKTGSYTVRGPLALGAALAGASDRQQSVLQCFGRPLGEAFQMRDDLLGTFGDGERTGKSALSDLRRGKRTALVRAAEQLGTDVELEPLRQVLSARGGTDQALERAREVLVTTGAKAAVEDRLTQLVESAREAVVAPLQEPGISMLLDLAARVGERDR